jgi:mono/diheme cytochrome c family protein
MGKNMPRQIVIFGAFGIAVSAFLFFNSLAQQRPTVVPTPDKVDYNWDVKPILSDNCFRCHGPDAKARQAGLRLDMPEVAYGVIARGKPEESLLVDRISSKDPGYRMPPPETHKQLSDSQIAILKKWIAQGAEYKPHWAYIPPVKPAPPQTRFQPRVVNDIDRFVFARLEREGLAPSPEADKETLLNRVSLTLTGLPPSLEEVDAFLADRSPDAYETLVDRLLASPTYGERMASYWMDVARFAESDGFLDDHHDRLLWPWRDWAISAFNNNMPFDQFATWQLAGDLLPNRTTEQLLATTFLRTGKRTTENGAIHEEYRVEYMLERTDLMGKAFLCLTVGCARCHDHKYDPISNKDYYSMSGFFNSTDEPGFYAPGHSAIQGGPTLPWPDAETQKKIETAEADIRTAEQSYNTVRQTAASEAAAAARALLTKPAAEIRQSLQKSISDATTGYYSFDSTVPYSDDLVPPVRPRGQAPPQLVSLRRGGGGPGGAAAAALFGGGGGNAGQRGGRGRLPLEMVADRTVMLPNAADQKTNGVVEAPIFKPGVKGNALYFDDVNHGYLGQNIGWYDRTQEFSFDLWLLVPKVYEDANVINHRDDDNSGGAGYTLDLENNRVQFEMRHSWPFNMLSVVTKQTVPLNQWVHLTVTYDGSSRANGIKMYWNGKSADVEIQKDNLTQSILPTSYAAAFDQFVGFAFGKRFRVTSLVGGAIDEVRVFNRALTPVEVSCLQNESNTPTNVEALTEWLVAWDSRVVEAKARLAEAREADNKIVTLVPQVLVMGDTQKPRPTYMLSRGLYNARGEEVQPEALSQIFSWNSSLPRNRLGFARWLFDPKHPLTARVLVNRLWMLQFGRGLVDTVEDFGSQGSIPTHPELLDWLALRLMESNWDIKAMLKLIVMSATYRQSSNATDELEARDPENRLLARGIRQRMTAEMIRDATLAESGLLVRAIGGPSMYPYQPEGIWEAIGSFYPYPKPNEIPPENHHRRTLYTFVKRNAPHPEMAVFDFPDRTAGAAGRKISNSPLQALALLNDPQYAEAYRVLATRAMATSGNKDQQLALVFRLGVRRRATGEELATIRRYYESQIARFSAAADDAKAFVNVGVTPVDPSVDPVQLAALTNVVAAVMNTPDAYSLR